jgi:hypothetical protein
LELSSDSKQSAGQLQITVAFPDFYDEKRGGGRAFAPSGWKRAGGRGFNFYSGLDKRGGNFDDEETSLISMF